MRGGLPLSCEHPPLEGGLRSQAILSLLPQGAKALYLTILIHHTIQRVEYSPYTHNPDPGG